MDIFEAIREDHDRMRQTLTDLLATKGDSEERGTLYEQVKQMLTAHEQAEERHFYIPLVQDDSTIEKTRHAFAEHSEADEIVEKLDKTEMGSSAWLTHAKKLHEALEHHMKEEEQEIFKLAGKVLDRQRQTELAERYRDEMLQSMH
jgi:hypothetical protein